MCVSVCVCMCVCIDICELLLDAYFAYNYTEIVSGLEENPKNVIRGEF